MGLFSGLKRFFGLDEGEKTAKSRASNARKAADQRRTKALEDALKRGDFTKKEAKKAAAGALGAGSIAQAKALAELDARSASQAKAARAQAAAERAQVMDDEASRFVRLRDAAQAGGFNPLSVLQAGFYGANLPSGVLSSAPSTVGNYLDATTIGSNATRDHLAASDSVAMARRHADSLTMNTRMTYDGLKADVQASGDSNVLTGIASDNSFLIQAVQTAIQGGSAWSAHKQGNRALDLDARRLELERAVASTGVRTPGWGESRVRRTSTPSLSRSPDGMPLDAVPRNSDGSVKNRDLAVNGATFDVDEDWSPVQYWEDEYGDVAGSIIGVGKITWDGFRNADTFENHAIDWAGNVGAANRERIRDWWRTLGSTWTSDNAFVGSGGGTPFKVEVN